MKAKIMSIEQDKPDIKRIIIVKPAGYRFLTGKSIPVGLLKPGLEDRRMNLPVMSTSNDYYLELMYKEPTRVDKFVESMAKLKAGEEIIIGDCAGGFDGGKGTFIVSGMGIVPAISWIRQLKNDEALNGVSLIYVAKSKEELLGERELRHLLGKNVYFLLGRESGFGYEFRRLEGTFFREKGINVNEMFYVAGPEMFVKGTQQVLLSVMGRAFYETTDN